MHQTIQRQLHSLSKIPRTVWTAFCVRKAAKVERKRQEKNSPNCYDQQFQRYSAEISIEIGRKRVWRLGRRKFVQNNFSDEKIKNLDGPEGLRSYWHCLKHEKKTFFSRQNGGGSVTVWGGIWYDGTTEIVF
jgi:hypothetical protein